MKSILLIAVLTLILVGCAHQPAPVPGADVPGFWWGLWNGFTAVPAFFGHLFGMNIRIYAFPNSGGWYDLGFLLGIGAFSGGTVTKAAKTITHR